MNIQNLKTAMKVLQRAGVVQNPSLAFRVIHRETPIIGARHLYYLDYANPSIETSLKSLANELSLAPALDRIGGLEREVCYEEPNLEHLLDPDIRRATDILARQLETAKTILDYCK